MNKPTTVKELCELIWYLEERYDLLDLEIQGVKPWQAHRIEIYYELGRLSGVFEKELQREMSKFTKLQNLKNFVVNSFLNNPLFNLDEVDVLVFSHPRSKAVDSQYIDIYSQYFIDDLQKENINFIEFEEHFNGKHIREKKSYKKYLDYINLMRNLKSKLIKIDLDSTVLNKIQKVEKEIYEILGSKYNLKDILLTRTKKFIVTYDIYKTILQRTNPKKVYLVVGYGRSELIKACKDLGIKTIELQHGTFSQYHLGYSYPDKQELDYFPNEFWVWNEYWKNLIEFSISQKNVKVYPFKYLEKEKQYYNLDKIKNQIVVLGQGGITDRMAKKILDNISLFRHKKIIFKLHPEEYGRSHLYLNLKTLKNILNIDILENTDLYKLLSESEYQAGVFSTALYEGVEFECKTILFDLPGIEYMDKFIKMYKVKVV